MSVSAFWKMVLFTVSKMPEAEISYADRMLLDEGSNTLLRNTTFLY
jgi:hypothetical protein